MVVVHVRALKTCFAAVEALGIKKRQDETQFIIKIAGKTSLGPRYSVLETFRSQLRIWCPIMLKLVVLTP